MAVIIDKKTIESVLPLIDVVAAMEEGFVSYSQGKAVVPPVGELIFEKPAGEAHIKYGYLKEDEYYVIKIASGFYENPKLGVSSSQGLMLIFSQKTGQPLAVLLDEGQLTDIRTAAAGALVAKYLAPQQVHGIGIVGTGIQAQLQLDYLRQITDCRTVWVWGRTMARVQAFVRNNQGDFQIQAATTVGELAAHCNLIVSTTAARSPLLFAADIRPGTHITAVGSDTADKQELDSEIAGMADLVVVDSLPQSQSRGEVYQAVSQGFVDRNTVVELGHLIQGNTRQRINDQQITVADLTGVAVQDIMIAKAVYLRCLEQKQR